MMNPAPFTRSCEAADEDLVMQPFPPFPDAAAEASADAAAAELIGEEDAAADARAEKAKAEEANKAKKAKAKKGKKPQKGQAPASTPKGTPSNGRNNTSDQPRRSGRERKSAAKREFDYTSDGGSDDDHN